MFIMSAIAVFARHSGHLLRRVGHWAIHLRKEKQTLFWIESLQIHNLTNNCLLSNAAVSKQMPATNCNQTMSLFRFAWQEANCTYKTIIVFIRQFYSFRFLCVFRWSGIHAHYALCFDYVIECTSKSKDIFTCFVCSPYFAKLKKASTDVKSIQISNSVA